MSGFPHVLRHLHKNVQRSASFALCVSRAPTGRSTSALQIAGNYRELIGRRVVVPPEAVERVRRYLVGKGLHLGLVSGGKTGATLEKLLATGQVLVELQDWFLSDPELPSSTGREHQKSFADTVSACAEMRFLSERTLTLDPYGALLVAIAQDTGAIGPLSVQNPNPFSPNPKLLVALFFQLLRCDFAMQRELGQWMPGAGTSFTKDLAPRAGSLLRAVAARIPVTAANREEVRWLARETERADRLKSQVSRSTNGQSHGRRVSAQTLYRPFENMLVSRIELLVDLGLATKPARDGYTYELTPRFEVYKQLTATGVQRIEDSFFAAMGDIFQVRGTALKNPVEILDHLRPSLRRLRGLTGYAGIAEATVHSNVAGFGAQWRYVEVADAHNALRELAGAQRPQVRVLADRSRRARDFAIVDDR